MVQVGCATACAGLACPICSSVQCRNGPPDAVRMIWRMPARCFSSKAWKMALCSESTGNRRAPASRAAVMNRSPAQTSASLLAKATAAPRRTASSVGGSPAAPTIAAITQSADMRAASQTASGPAALRMDVPCSAASSAGPASGSATAQNCAFVRIASAARSADWLFAVSATTSNAPWGARSIRSSVARPTEPVAPRIVTVRALMRPLQAIRPARPRTISRRKGPPSSAHPPGPARRHARGSPCRHP